MSLDMREQFSASLQGDVSPEEEAARTLQENLEDFIRQSQDS
jgi:hypothetical protein